MPSIDDLFPPYDRELYRRAPDVLLSVAFEVRFPRILRLESKLPTDFQEAVSEQFPLYERVMNIEVTDGSPIPPEVLQALASQAGGDIAHQFLSEDRKTTLSLTPEKLNVVLAANYTTWEDFRLLLELAVNALTSKYKVPFFTRVGLRYQDAIHRTTLGIESLPWTDLVNPRLLGTFPFDRFEQHTVAANHLLAISLPDGSGRVSIRHGLVNVRGKQGLAYGLDFDFSDQPKIETADVYKRGSSGNRVGDLGNFRALEACM